MSIEEVVMAVFAGVGVAATALSVLAGIAWCVDRLVWRPRDQRDAALWKVQLLEQQLKLQRRS